VCVSITCVNVYSLSLCYILHVQLYNIKYVNYGCWSWKLELWFVVHLQQYDRARKLIVAADGGVREISFKLSKILRWEMLKVDLLQSIDRDAACTDVTGQELPNRCRVCVTSALRDNCEQTVCSLLTACVQSLSVGALSRYLAIDCLLPKSWDLHI